MTTNGTLSLRPQPGAAASGRRERTALGETLLLRFLVRHRIVPEGLIVALQAERDGAHADVSVVDWMVQRGHITEEQLAAALIWCLRLTPHDLAAYAADPALADAPQAPAPARTRRASHLRLVSSQSAPFPPDQPAAERPRLRKLCRGAS